MLGCVRVQIANPQKISDSVQRSLEKCESNPRVLLDVLPKDEKEATLLSKRVTHFIVLLPNTSNTHIVKSDEKHANDGGESDAMVRHPFQAAGTEVVVAYQKELLQHPMLVAQLVCQHIFAAVADKFVFPGKPRYLFSLLKHLNFLGFHDLRCETKSTTRKSTHTIKYVLHTLSKDNKKQQRYMLRIYKSYQFACRKLDVMRRVNKMQQQKREAYVCPNVLYHDQYLRIAPYVYGLHEFKSGKISVQNHANRRIFLCVCVQ